MLTMWTVRSWERAWLARSATRYAAHGWDVVPGAVYGGGRFRCDTGCPTVGCHPATGYWQDTATRDVDLVARWWRRAPYAILLPTGRAFDVLDLPVSVGMLVTPRCGPVAIAPNGRRLFFVRPGNGLRAELAEQLDVLRHGLGSWVPAPPTREPAGRARWLVSPEAVGWRLPGSHQVQNMIAAALATVEPTVRRPRRRPVHWPVNPAHKSLSGAPPGR
jgi:hypothetical protein